MCEQEDFRCPYSDDEAEDGGDPEYGSQIVLSSNGQLPVGGASEVEQGLSPWTGEAQELERLEMPPPTKPQAQAPQAQKTKSRHSNLKKVAIQFAATGDSVAAAGRSRGAGTRPGYYKAMYNGQ